MPPPLQRTLSTGKAFAIAVAVVVAALVLPFGVVVTRPVVWVGTLFHELGHGLGAIAVGGGFSELVVNWSGGGHARVYFGSDAAHAVSLMAGLVGPAIAGAVGFVLARGPRRARFALAGGAVLLAWAMIFHVRSTAGFVTAAPLCAILAVVAVRKSATHPQITLMVLSVLLALNSWQDRHYMLSSSPGSDIAKFADIVGGPVWLWGGLCILASLAVLGLGLLVTLRDARSRPQRTPSAG